MANTHSIVSITGDGLGIRMRANLPATCVDGRVNRPGIREGSIPWK